VHHKGVNLDCGYRIDLLIDQQLIIELKSVERLTSIDEAQLITYRKLANVRTGLLMNFNCDSLKNGIKRFVN